MTVEISPAPEAERIGQDCIARWHPHLAEVGILYLFTTQERKEDRKPVAATIQRLTPMQRFLIAGSTLEGEEYVILINRDRWMDLDNRQRKALLDHELCHLVESEPDDAGDTHVEWSKGHDVQLFVDEVRRHGAWHENIAVVAKQLALWEAEHQPAAV